MIELLLVLGLAVLVWLFSRAIVWVIYYVFMYNFIAQLAFIFLGDLINFNDPSVFWVSRLIFLVLAFVVGGIIQGFIAHVPFLRVVIIAILIIFTVWFLAQNFDFNFYHYQIPLPSENTLSI